MHIMFVRLAGGFAFAAAGGFSPKISARISE
jgi:hypothetical protein